MNEQEFPHNSSHIDVQEAIEKIAQDLWIAAGQPKGRDLEFWLKAEEIWINRQSF